jgi:hypothetical protein
VDLLFRGVVVSPELQIIFNILMLAAGGLGTFLMKEMWEMLRKLQHDDISLTKSISDLEKLVVGDYIKRAEMERVIRDQSVYFEKLLQEQNNHLRDVMERFMTQDLEGHANILKKLDQLYENLIFNRRTP